MMLKIYVCPAIFFAAARSGIFLDSVLFSVAIARRSLRSEDFVASRGDDDEVNYWESNIVSDGSSDHGGVYVSISSDSVVYMRSPIFWL